MLLLVHIFLSGTEHLDPVMHANLFQILQPGALCTQTDDVIWLLVRTTFLAILISLNSDQAEL